MIIISIFDERQVNTGPLLSDLPEIVGEASNKYGLNIKNAVNLDGGACSAFISGSTALPELVRSGSFLCIRDFQSN
jgi:exopolysaccharide biosynthesis protein